MSRGQESRGELSRSSSGDIYGVGDSRNITKRGIGDLVESRVQVGQRNASAGASIDSELNRLRDEIRGPFDVGHVRRCLRRGTGGMVQVLPPLMVK